MLDKKKIMDLLKKYFETTGKITIDDEGLVSTTGRVELKQSHKHLRLPVAFGTVGGGFYCNTNQLTTLVGAPQTVGGDFYCSNNQLTTLAGAPQTVGGVFYCINNKLTTLEGIPTQLRKLWLSYSPNLPLLRTLYAQHIAFDPKIDDPKLLEILNRYAGEGKRGAIRCQKELIAAGFEGNAKW